MNGKEEKIMISRFRLQAASEDTQPDVNMAARGRQAGRQAGKRFFRLFLFFLIFFLINK
jgi:hypothetical protein